MDSLENIRRSICGGPLTSLCLNSLAKWLTLDFGPCRLTIFPPEFLGMSMGPLPQGSTPGCFLDARIPGLGFSHPLYAHKGNLPSPWGALTVATVGLRLAVRMIGRLASTFLRVFLTMFQATQIRLLRVPGFTCQEVGWPPHPPEAARNM